MKKVIKGFTLVELIVVLAIFSVVLAAATSMMQPVAKIMVLADIRESGATQVSQISNYLEMSLSTAEYINTANYVVDDPTLREQMVDRFVDDYYSGVLKDGATISDPKYGSGLVHVMTIDNNNSGHISEYVYEVDFTPYVDSSSKHVIKQRKNGADNPEDYYAVNQASYDEYTYKIYPGATEYTGGVFNFVEFMTKPNDVTSTSFTIDASTVRHKGQKTEQEYNFSGTATVHLVNISNPARKNGVPVGTYFALAKDKDSEGRNPGDEGYVDTYNIFDLADIVDVLHGTVPAPSKIASTKTTEGIGLKDDQNDIDKIKDTGGMTFIYSFGAEMSTD
jgi:prepilin-type N-terminal cleavage/methylation domain-containing protein